MTTLTMALDHTKTTLENNALVQSVVVLEAVEYSSDQFRFRVRANLGSGIKFQVHLYYNKKHIDYSYQVFGKFALVRWDNKEEFPDITTFPHHHHNLDADVVESPLIGDPDRDLPRVLEWIAQKWNNIRAASRQNI